MLFTGILNVNKIEKINNIRYNECEINLFNKTKNKHKLSLFKYYIKYSNKIKDVVNKYILFELLEDTFLNKDSILCKIYYIIGDVDKYESFIEYYVFCKRLYNIEFLKFDYSWKNILIRESFIDDIIINYNIENRINNDILSIDPNDCYIIDDAIGYSIRDNIEIISIYIPNISLWIDYLNLSEKFLDIKNKNLKNIELNNKIKNKLILNILEKEFFSLIKLKRHICFTIDLYILDNKIIDIKFINSVINLNKNYKYYDNKILLHNTYNIIYNKTRYLNKNHKYMSKIINNNTVIEYFMILINKHISKLLEKEYIHITSPIKYLNDIIVMDLVNNKLQLF